MATGTKLQLTFVTGGGGTAKYTYNYAKSNATTANVKALAAFILDNNSYFNANPVAIKSAKTITTSENTYDMSELAKEFPDFASRIVLNAGKDYDIDSDTPDVEIPENAPGTEIKNLK